jgi:hypothetical protein
LDREEIGAILDTVGKVVRVDQSAATVMSVLEV